MSNTDTIERGKYSVTPPKPQVRSEPGCGTCRHWLHEAKAPTGICRAEPPKTNFIGFQKTALGHQQPMFFT